MTRKKTPVGGAKGAAPKKGNWLDQPGTTLTFEQLLELACTKAKTSARLLEEDGPDVPAQPHLADSLQARLVVRWNHDHLDEELWHRYELSRPADKLNHWEVTDLVCLHMIDELGLEAWKACTPETMRDMADQFAAQAFEGR